MMTSKDSTHDLTIKPEQIALERQDLPPMYLAHQRYHYHQPSKHKVNMTGTDLQTNCCFCDNSHPHPDWPKGTAKPEGEDRGDKQAVIEQLEYT